MTFQINELKRLLLGYNDRLLDLKPKPYSINFKAQDT